MTFRLLHSAPRAASQPIAKACACYIYIIIIQALVCLGCVTKVLGCCCVPYWHEKDKHWEQCHAEMGFYRVKYNLISHHMC